LPFKVEKGVTKNPFKKRKEKKRKTHITTQFHARNIKKKKRS